MSQNSGAAVDSPLMRAVGVFKSFGDAKVLNGIDMQAREGEVICIIGPSGSGKSTFLRCVNYLERFDSGAVWVNGRLIGHHMVGNRLHELSARQIAKRRCDVGMVFQQFNLFLSMTALQNVSIAPVRIKGESRESATKNALALLDRVGLADRVNYYPSQLSGGQQQRVAIARALAMRPKLLLLDEPTSALDPETVGEVLDVIRDLAQSGMSMIIVTHELAFARDVADRVVFMDEGQIVEEGEARELFNNPRSERLKSFLGAMRRSGFG